MNDKVLITAALPYANGSIHLGHLAGAYLPADVYARFCRLVGLKTLFICGSDEYGTAIVHGAELAKRTPKEQVDLFHQMNKELFQKTVLYKAVREDQEDVYLESLRDVLKFVQGEGKKGLTIQRYKGLGEMNPEQLWETTMDPEKRTVLKVALEDAVEADKTFTTLMGDEVEPRREFIHKYAREVKNLDV